MERQGKPSKQYSGDAEFFRDYAIGCLVIILVFILGSALIAYMWLR